jgi:regulator of vacuolar morphogenesis
MPDKRKASMAAPSSKRARITYDDEGEQSSVTSYEKPYNNPIYGQKNAFPGLDNVSEELCYDDADDGLEYLRMVR